MLSVHTFSQHRPHRGPTSAKSSAKTPSKNHLTERPAQSKERRSYGDTNCAHLHDGFAADSIAEPAARKASDNLYDGEYAFLQAVIVG